MINPRLLIILFFAFNTALAANHQLQIDLHPQSGNIKASDHIKLPASCKTLRLQLSSNLQISHISNSFKQTARHANNSWQTLELKRISSQPLIIQYHGKIQHAVRSNSKTHESGGVLSSRGWIGEQGIYLGPESGWYPQLLDCDNGFDTHKLQVRFPDDQSKQWQSLSQGDNTANQNHWIETQPQQGLYLLAARWTKYELGRSRVWLRSPDPVLAERYLHASERYLAQYELLLGAYPYSHFTLAENFWESGFGMPGFTLLGSQVIRLPFIVNSAFPHEILHNWFGNGVYVDTQQGNWSEALTTYLADHWIKEKQGKGKNYRFRQLQRYTTHSRKQTQNEAALSAFTARHNGLSQAIGYSKGLMTFHMLRRQIGDAAFLKALRSFYRKQRFRIASWQDLRIAFEAASGQQLGDFFKTWIQRSGAPQLSAKATSKVSANTYATTIHLQQTQAGPAWPMPVQLALQTADGNWQQQQIIMSSKDTQLTMLSKTKPQQLQIDPEHDIFRRLTADETPISIGHLNTAGETTTLIVPEPTNNQPANDSMAQAYLQLAKQWATDPDINWQYDRPELALPREGRLWILGKHNRKLKALLSSHQLSTPNDKAFHVDQPNSAPNSAWIISGQRRTNKQPQSIGWLIASKPSLLTQAARLFKHYGRYGYVGFIEGSRQRIKGNWPAPHSPLNMPLSPTTDLSAQPPATPPLNIQAIRRSTPSAPQTSCK